MRRRLPLGWHLAVLVACAVVPMLVFAVVLVARVTTEERAREERTLLDVSRALAHALDREILLNVGMLELLAKSPHLAAGDLAAFHAEAQRVVHSRPAWTSVLLFAADGEQLVNTMIPWGAPLVRVNDPESLEIVIRTGRPAVGALVAGRASGQLAFPVRVPIVRDGRVVYVLTAAVRPQSLQPLLIDAIPPRGEWTRAFSDRRGVIAARSRDPERFVGQAGTPEFVRRSRSMPEAFYRDTTIDGADAYIAFSHAAFSGWTAGVAFPVALIDGPVRRSMALMVGSGLVMVGVTAAAAYVAGRRIARPIRAATEAAHALARGES
ncbi:MAG: cache domain-containing protein, partial [Candidatus Rokubacteria bacterium]|nr:cache domain-containing protein [Candidatus Rokubacteria bacterium]